MDINLHTGEQVQKMVERTTSTPQEIVAKVKAAMAMKGESKSGASGGP